MAPVAKAHELADEERVRRGPRDHLDHETISALARLIDGWPKGWRWEGQMDVVSESAAKDPETPLRRVAEPVGFALASLGIQLLPLAFWSLPIFGESPDVILLSSGMGLVMFASLTCLAFAAGWRRSRLDLLAVFAGWVVGLICNYLPMLLGSRT